MSSIRTALHLSRRRTHRPGSSLTWILDRPATTPAAREERLLLSRR